jgi:argininosuccinate lyase
VKIDPTKLHMMQVDEAIEKFTVGEDYILDRALVEADCFGSAGHAAGLRKIGFLSEDDHVSLAEGLREIVGLARRAEFNVRREQEDCHTAIETHLTASRGEVGKRIHAGRSRNDQVVCAMRLWSKWEMLLLARELVGVAVAATEFAREHKDVPMVGRTHMQRAMPSSVGLWMGALAEALADDLDLLWAAYDLNDQCPLGSAASYGVPLPLEREFVSEQLGFARLQSNSIYVANSRGKVEAAILGACSQAMLDLSRYAQDLMLFSMPEFGYFSIPVEMCTGSSIMPQKRNPCAMELVRARTSTVLAEAERIRMIVKGLPTGYNRDGQETKEPFMKGIAVTRASVGIMAETIRRLEVNTDKLIAAFHPEVFATDVALELVAAGKPFRDAYREVKEKLGQLGDMDPREALAKKTHAGTTGNLGLDVALAAVDRHGERIHREIEKARRVFEALMAIEGPSVLGGPEGV